MKSNFFKGALIFALCIMMLGIVNAQQARLTITSRCHDGEVGTICLRNPNSCDISVYWQKYPGPWVDLPVTAVGNSDSFFEVPWPGDIKLCYMLNEQLVSEYIEQTIIDCIPPEVRFKYNQPCIHEGTCEPYPAKLRITLVLSKIVNYLVSVDWKTVNGSAEDESGDNDYLKSLGTVVFEPGQSEIHFYIPLVKDCKVEDHEAFYVKLYNPVNAKILEPECLCYIKNDDYDPVADFTATPTEGIDEVCVQFKNLSQYAKEFLWDFGDGTTSTEKDPKHVFSWTRKHNTITLTAFSGDCCDKSNKIVKTNYITVYHRTHVAYMPNIIAGLPDLPVTFTNNSGGNASHFEWDYGDGTVEKLIHGTSAKEKIHPTHTYQKEGLYTVKLKGYGHGGEDIMEVKQVILVDKKFAALELISSGATMDTCVGWECAIDQNAMLLDKQIHVKPGDDAWAVFGFADTIARKVDKIRICANNVLGTCYLGHELKDFQIMTSMDGVNFTECMCGTIQCHCGFDTYNKFTPVEAKFIKIVLKNARDKNAPCIALHEIQVFGDKVTAAPLAKGILADNEISTVTDFGLSQNFPNPFNPVTMINFKLPNSEYVTLKVYNIQGQEVASLVDGQMETGQHRIAFDASKLQSGTYFYEMKAGQFRDIKRMIFIK